MQLIQHIKSFNQFTQVALIEKVGGYVNKSKSLEEEILLLKKEYNLEKIYRFDLGENTDGFSPEVEKYIQSLVKNQGILNTLHRYPDITYQSLRERISKMFGVQRQHIVISSGLDSVIDLISRVFLSPDDTFLMPVPSFFLFESYSKRMGAQPIYINLNENENFAVTPNIVNLIKGHIIKYHPKMLWLATPNNPTGQKIDENILEAIIDVAYMHNVFVVADEAYHEFVGNPEHSAAKHTARYSNLIVLRSFSKALGLAGIRLGYAICSNPHVIEALLLHRQHFPITQLSLSIARIALKDNQFIENSRNQTQLRRHQLFQKFSLLNSFKIIPSDTNIFMMRHKHLSANIFDSELKKTGIIASKLSITGLFNDDYLRFTICTPTENDYLFNCCQQIDNGYKLFS